MADNYIEISHLVPLNFVDVNRSLPANYHFKHFDEWKASEQLLPWETAPAYCQKWQNNDIIFLQVRSNYDPVFVKVLNEDDVEVNNFQMDVAASIGGVIYLQAEIALTGLPEGCYKVQLLAGDPVQVTLESEWFHVAESHPGTLLYRYSHGFNDKNILFEPTDIYAEGIYFTLRVEGVLSEYEPGGKRVTYIDQKDYSSTVKGSTFRAFTLYIGDEFGVPNWMVDKIKDIFDLNNVTIDGKGFSAIDDKLKPKREENYGWAGWTIAVRETNNRGAKRFESTGLVDEKVTIDYIVEGKLFGPIAGSANDNTYVISEIE